MKLRLILLVALVLAVPIAGHSQDAVEILSTSSHAYEDRAQTISTIELDNNSIKYMNMLDLPTIKKNLEKLASQEFEGRGSGQPGGTLTQDFLKIQMKEIGVIAPKSNDYTQDIGRYSGEKTTYRFDFENFNYENDYGYSNSFMKDTIITTREIVFLGYGDYSATINNFSDIDITNKVVMLLEGESTNKWGINYTVNNTKDKYLMEKRPKAVISVKDGFSSYFSVYTGRKYAADNQNQERQYINDIIPQITINERLANKMLEKTGKTVKHLKYEIEESGAVPPIFITTESDVNIKSQLSYTKTDTKNIIGIIEGTDLKDEYIVLMAHHDHEGKSSYYDRIYYGADDNASGVSAVLEMARIFAKAKKEKNAPRRSIIILFPASEEEGMKGSNHYVKNPLYPLNKTKACINLDMVGRRDPDNAKGNYVYVSKNSTSSDLASRIEKMAIASSLETSVIATDRNYSRSDHYNFSQQSIPSIMLTGGEHSDYHTERDKADAIEYDLLLKRAQLAFLTVWDLANPAK